MGHLAISKYSTPYISLSSSVRQKPKRTKPSEVAGIRTMAQLISITPLFSRDASVSSWHRVLGFSGAVHLWYTGTPACPSEVSPTQLGCCPRCKQLLFLSPAVIAPSIFFFWASQTVGFLRTLLGSSERVAHSVTPTLGNLL